MRGKSKEEKCVPKSTWWTLEPRRGRFEVTLRGGEIWNPKKQSDREKWPRPVSPPSLITANQPCLIKNSPGSNSLEKKVITSGKPLLISVPLCFRWPPTHIDRSLKWFGDGESIDFWRTFTSLINFSMIPHYKVRPVTSATPMGTKCFKFWSLFVIGGISNKPRGKWDWSNGTFLDFRGQPVTITTNPRNFQCVQTPRERLQSFLSAVWVNNALHRQHLRALGSA